jgi:hypothetical protein
MHGGSSFSKQKGKKKGDERKRREFPENEVHQGEIANNCDCPLEGTLEWMKSHAHTPAHRFKKAKMEHAKHCILHLGGTNDLRQALVTLELVDEAELRPTLSDAEFDHAFREYKNGIPMNEIPKFAKTFGQRKQSKYKVQKRLNQRMEDAPKITETSTGYQMDMKEHLQKLLLRLNDAGKLTGESVEVVVMVDSAGMTNKFQTGDGNFNLMGIMLPLEVASVADSRSSHFFHTCVVWKGPETHENVAENCKDALQFINSLVIDPVLRVTDTLSVNIKVQLCADLKEVVSLLGLKAVYNYQSEFACFCCTAPHDQLHKFDKEFDMRKGKEHNALLENGKKAPLKDGYKTTPLLKVDPNGTVMDTVVVDSLHLLIRTLVMILQKTLGNVGDDEESAAQLEIYFKSTVKLSFVPQNKGTVKKAFWERIKDGHWTYDVCMRFLKERKQFLTILGGAKQWKAKIQQIEDIWNGYAQLIRVALSEKGEELVDGATPLPFPRTEFKRKAIEWGKKLVREFKSPVVTSYIHCLVMHVGDLLDQNWHRISTFPIENQHQLVRKHHRNDFPKKTFGKTVLQMDYIRKSSPPTGHAAEREAERQEKITGPKRKQKKRKSKIMIPSVQLL